MPATPNDLAVLTASQRHKPGAAGWSKRFGVLALAAGLLAVGACSSNDDDGDASEADTVSVDDFDEAVAAADEAAAAAEEAQAELDAAEANLEAVEADLTATEAELVTATEERDQAVADATAAQEQLAENEALLAEIQTIAGQFPITVESSLIPEDMPGTYSITYQEAYCDPGFVLCGTTPAATAATIYFDANNFLRIGVEGAFDAGLFALDGSLYGITDSQNNLQSCSGAERRARVTITMFAGTVTIEDDGTRVVNDVNASINLDASTDGPDCPGGIQFFAATLTPQG